LTAAWQAATHAEWFATGDEFVCAYAGVAAIDRITGTAHAAVPAVTAARRTNSRRPMLAGSLRLAL
jgi:hypothetical protein